MTFNLDADLLVRSGREAERVARALREAGALIDFGPTETRDTEAVERLRRRAHRVAFRTGTNGRHLQDFVAEAEAVDQQVSLTFLLLSGRWR